MKAWLCVVFGMAVVSLVVCVNLRMDVERYRADQELALDGVNTLNDWLQDEIAQRDAEKDFFVVSVGVLADMLVDEAEEREAEKDFYLMAIEALQKRVEALEREEAREAEFWRRFNAGEFK